eukprot:GILK01012119.1.p1 GENE.GILK01012119.1~~GILK01012119.1.p1  ORF type:complete len:342 (-),score=71.20 GILK01012119.1:891-1916(-)
MSSPAYSSAGGDSSRHTRHLSFDTFNVSSPRYEALKILIERKEKDAKLAAEIGHNLLLENQELSQTCQTLQGQLEEERVRYQQLETSQRILQSRYLSTCQQLEELERHVSNLTEEMARMNQRHRDRDKESHDAGANGAVYQPRSPYPVSSSPLPDHTQNTSDAAAEKIEQLRLKWKTEKKTSALLREELARVTEERDRLQSSVVTLQKERDKQQASCQTLYQSLQTAEEQLHLELSQWRDRFIVVQEELLRKERELQDSKLCLTATKHGADQTCSDLESALMIKETELSLLRKELGQLRTKSLGRAFQDAMLRSHRDIDAFLDDIFGFPEMEIQPLPPPTS